MTHLELDSLDLECNGMTPHESHHCMSRHREHIADIITHEQMAELGHPILVPEYPVEVLYNP